MKKIIIGLVSLIIIFTSCSEENKKEELIKIKEEINIVEKKENIKEDKKNLN